MTPADPAVVPEEFGRAVGRLGPAILALLDAIEQLARRLEPLGFGDAGPPRPGAPAASSTGAPAASSTGESAAPRPADLLAALAPLAARLDEARTAFAASAPPEALAGFAAQLAAGAAHTARAAECLRGAAAGAGGVAQALAGLHEHARAQAALFPLRAVLPPLDAWFLEPGAAARLAELRARAPDRARTGLLSAGNAPEQRGGFTLFVPDDYDEARGWPLVTALHGGFGHGADFVFAWLREARTRGWLVLAPTSRDTTWSLAAPELDGRALDSMLGYVRERWRVDATRLLLAGLSDGGSFALLHGLAEASPFTHLATVAGVLHPLNAVNGNLARARGRRIRLVHGARDWLFPVALAREAARVLGGAGARLDYDEVEDLAHGWPRERVAGLLDWVERSAEPAP